jgi:Flp pilus assembly protein TadG
MRAQSTRMRAQSTRMAPPSKPPRDGERGQAVTELALVLIPFMLMLFGILDLGRGMYAYNAVAEAAREIARVTSVHAGDTLGESDETAAVVSTQYALIPGMEAPAFSCVDITGVTVAGDPCLPGNRVRVNVSAPFQPVTPLLLVLGTMDIESSSSIQIP